MTSVTEFRLEPWVRGGEKKRKKKPPTHLQQVMKSLCGILVVKSSYWKFVFLLPVPHSDLGFHSITLNHFGFELCTLLYRQQISLIVRLRVSDSDLIRPAFLFPRTDRWASKSSLQKQTFRGPNGKESVAILSDQHSTETCVPGLGPVESSPQNSICGFNYPEPVCFVPASADSIGADTLLLPLPVDQNKGLSERALF